VGIDQFRPPADLELEEPAFVMRLWRFTSAKYQLNLGHDVKATTILVGWDSLNLVCSPRGAPSNSHVSHQQRGQQVLSHDGAVPTCLGYIGASRC